MAGFPYGVQVIAGTNATATQHNNTRKDGLTRWFKFEVIGTLTVANKQGGSYLVPFAGAVVQMYSVMTSGSCTYRINSAANVIKTGVSASSSAAVDSTPTTTAVAKNDLLTMDIVTISTGVDLVVMVEILPTP